MISISDHLGYTGSRYTQLHVYAGGKIRSFSGDHLFFIFLTSINVVVTLFYGTP